MMQKILIYFIFVVTYILQQSFAQTSKIDSLFKLLKTDKEDTNKVNHLNSLGQLKLNTKPDTAFLMYKQALAIAENQHWKNGIASSLGQLGVYNHEKSNYPLALDCYLKALKIYEDLNYKKGIAKCLGNMGVIYRDRSDYTKALYYQFKALRMDETQGEKKAIATDFGNIGSIYLSQGNYPKALDYYLKALKLSEELGDKNGMLMHLNNIGFVYTNLSDYPEAISYYLKALTFGNELEDKKGISDILGGLGNVYVEQSNYPKALDYYNKCLKIDEELGDKKGMAMMLGNIGVAFDYQGDYTKAKDYYLKALEKNKELGDKNGIAVSLCNIGQLYITMGNYSKAEPYILDALAIDKEIGAKNEERVDEESLTELYEKMGKYKEAFNHYKSAIQLKDSIFSIENKKQLIKKELNFEYEKKQLAAKAEQDKKDAIVTEEKQKQKIVTVLVSLVLCLVVVFSIFLYNRFRTTKKQKLIIEQQKTLVDNAYEALHEKNNEVLDSINYAKRIQHSFLATTEVLDESLKEYFVFFKPKDIVSGDFYWADTLSNGNFILATADSTGHGVPGAIMSLLNITSLEKAIEHQTNPAEILNHTRKTIIARLKKDGSVDGGKDGMDCSLLVFDFANKQLQIAAANNPIWIIRNNSLIEIKPDKMPVGKSDREMESFTLHTIELFAGDTIYTLTDGFPDQFGGPRGKKFMSKKLKELLIANVNFPILQQKEVIELTFKNWVGDLEQVDDICVIGIKI